MPAAPLPIDIIERRMAVLAEHGGNAVRAAAALGISRGALQNTIASQALDRSSSRRSAPGRLHYEIDQGAIVVFSDSHWWPGQPLTTANRALLHFCKTLKPKAVIGNGDMVDGATISRHPPICWEKRPRLVDEIDTVVERLNEIMAAAPNATRFWPAGNHDGRLESRLAQVAPEYARLKGVHLHDHMPPGWQSCWSVHVNNNTMIKHRDKHPRMAAKEAAMSVVTGHRHALAVYPFTSMGRGTLWGVDTGTLADPFGPQFEYMEDGQRDHRSGFVILNYYDRELVYPEVVFVADEAAGVVHFRGRVIHV